MRPGADMLMQGTSGGNAVTCSLRNLTSTSVPVSINGFYDVSFGGWVRNCAAYISMPCWAESGGWGGTYFGRNANTIECRLGSGSSSTKQQWTYSVEPDVWHHYYFVRSGSTMYFYVDGVLQAQSSCGSGALRNNATEFSFEGFVNRMPMGYDWDVGDFVDTSIVGLAFFSRALSQQEIAVARGAIVADLSVPPYNDGCVLAVNCNEGAGDRIRELVTGEEMVLSSPPEWNVHFPVV